MQTMTRTKPQTRIQREKTQEIMEAALDVFSKAGFTGASVNKIAALANMSTPSMLYYYSSKEEIHKALLQRVLELWVEPLDVIAVGRDPVESILDYVRKNLELSFAHPRQIRVLANEIVMGFPSADSGPFDRFRQVYEAKIIVIEAWREAGQIADIDAHHLMHLIWSITESYANCESRLATLSPTMLATLKDDAYTILLPLFRRLLTPA